METTQTSPLLHFELAYIVVCVMCLFILHYYVANAKLHATQRGQGDGQKPPHIPYFIPMLGHLPFSFLRDPLKFSLT
ncbi:hypothetical protein M426DRAFT_135440 [Hypoxylon sp. CI-4A]|nr:hypothetical protein M426DRAFT_135440 [Hypoxylon sp. CI-4A]